MSLSAFDRKIRLLSGEMAAAVAREDYETAARLRDEIAVLNGQSGHAEAPQVRQPPPGQMGLGSGVPVAEPPKGWVRPKKPDPMTKNHKGRRR